MKEIKDNEKIRQWMEKTEVSSRFDTPDLEFQAFQYEKGEMITSPSDPLTSILILAEGKMRIYGIRPEGEIMRVSLVSGPEIIGDMEYVTGGKTTFFVEALTEVVCLRLPLEKYRSQLDRDVRFLHSVLRSFAAKLELFTSLTVTSASVEERLLFFLKNICPPEGITSVEETTLHLRCSRRQLQRALKALLEKGVIEKNGKGHYRLTE